MRKIKNLIRLRLFGKAWKKANQHNRTYPGNLFELNSVTVGKGTYGQLNVRKFGNGPNVLRIGNYCSIADETVFLVDGGHPYETISTYPFKQGILGSFGESTSKGDIIVEDDVWIGYRSLILSGVHIGQGAVIAAGAIVSKDVPPYAIVGGVPAKVIRYRFNPEIIEELLKVDYSKLTKEEIEAHIDELYTVLKEKKQLNWMPKNVDR